MIWVAVIGGLFLLLWWQGQVQRLATYITETREELKKCAWPSWEELKGSTALIIIMVALLGGAIVGIDAILYKFSFNPFGLAAIAAAGYAFWNFVLLKRQ